jgi:glycosyltransferase involved in cell wall biosynthesis
LFINEKEGCLSHLSLFHRVGRIILRLLDLHRIKKFKYFLANSFYIQKIHHVKKAIIQYPPLRFSDVSKIVDYQEKDPFTVIFVGRITTVKGTDDILEILNLLPQKYRLVVVGDGPMLPMLKQLSSDLNLTQRIQFTGWLDSTQVYEKIKKAGVTIIPSLWDEAFGVVGIESFINGTPVVAYDVGGISEWCKKPYGVTVRCGDYSEAAKTIIRLTSNQIEWKLLSNQCIAYARANFSQEKFNLELEEFLKRF